MATPFLDHWKVGAGVPDADAMNVALPPAAMVWLAGWVVKVGAMAAAPPDTLIT